jgi:hypothetical protein
MRIVKVYSKDARATSVSAPSIQSAGGAPVILFSEHKKKKIFLFRRHAKWHGKHTQTTCGEKSKRAKFLWIIRRIVNAVVIFFYSCRFEINGGKNGNSLLM